MTLQTYLDSKNITKYHLSKISGVPKTTILDICAGRSSLERCSARTVRQLAKALDCSMEDIMAMAEEQPETETPETEESEDDSYLECGLPPFLQESVEAMAAAWHKAGNLIVFGDCNNETGRRGGVSALGLRLLQPAERHQQCGGQSAYKFGTGMVFEGKISGNGKGVTKWQSLILRSCPDGIKCMQALTEIKSV